MNYYKTIEPNQHVCNICHNAFKQIYDTNHDIEMKKIQPKIDKNYIIDSLIKSLKDNVEQLQLENDILQNSLNFYRNIYHRNIHKLC